MHKREDLTREQLELIYNNTSDLVFLIEVLGKGRYAAGSVNQAYLEHTRQRAEDVVGRPIEASLQGEDLAYVIARYDEAVAHGGPWSYATRAWLGGQTVYLDTTLVPVFDAEGACTHLIGVSRDTTRAHLEQRALQHEKQRAENYLNIAEALIVALDRVGNITLLNRKGYAMLGYPEGSLVGANWFDRFIAEERGEQFRSAFRRMMATGEATRRNVNYVRTRSGERLLINWANAIVFDEAGRVAGLLSSGEDITDRHRAEQAMIASQRVLAADEVVSAVAHDFNNSLQGILGNVEMALQVSEDAEQVRAYLGAAGKLADDAARRLRVLRGISGPNVATELEILNVHELIDDVLAQTRPLWKDEAERHGRRLTVSRDFGGELRPVKGNRGELRSVLYNIVKNSIEALAEDGEIRFATSYREGCDFITVTDTGSGMDSDACTRIFQPFFSTKGLESGRGLGMSASHNIVRAHGGEIRVLHSSPGQGTAIEVRLPVLAPDVRSVVHPPRPRRAVQHNVLWVDDDPQIRILAAEYLRLMGHTGDVAGSGSEALQLMDSNRYTAVITDVGMPAMNGLELAEHIHRRFDGALPVVALTGWGDSIDDGRPISSSIVRVLAKPARLEELREVLGAVTP